MQRYTKKFPESRCLPSRGRLGRCMLARSGPARSKHASEVDGVARDANAGFRCARTGRCTHHMHPSRPSRREARSLPAGAFPFRAAMTPVGPACHPKHRQAGEGRAIICRSIIYLPFRGMGGCNTEKRPRHPPCVHAARLSPSTSRTVDRVPDFNTLGWAASLSLSPRVSATCSLRRGAMITSHSVLLIGRTIASLVDGRFF
jgi:hypothetical protein